MGLSPSHRPNAREPPRQVGNLLDALCQDEKDFWRQGQRIERTDCLRPPAAYPFGGCRRASLPGPHRLQYRNGMLPTNSKNQTDLPRRSMTDAEQRIAELIRKAFQGVALGNGIGLRQAQGLDDYANSKTLARYRERDEKEDWSRIPASELNECYSSLSFFDAEGMRFHLPAYLIAGIEGKLACDVMFHLTCIDEYKTSQLSGLNAIQRNAVREYLLFCLSQSEVEPGSKCWPAIWEIERALSSYWTASE